MSDSTSAILLLHCLLLRRVLLSDSETLKRDMAIDIAVLGLKLEKSFTCWRSSLEEEGDAASSSEISGLALRLNLMFIRTVNNTLMKGKSVNT